MPCPSCRSLLAVHPDKPVLFCPRCSGGLVENPGVVRGKANYLLNNQFNDDNLVGLLSNYRKRELIQYLLRKLNEACSAFMQGPEIGLELSAFRTYPYLLKQVYSRNEFGDDSIIESDSIEKEVSTVQLGYEKLISTIRNARNGFSVAVKQPSYSGKVADFTSDYTFFQSEKGLCFERCVKSTFGADKDTIDIFQNVAETFRSFERTDPENASSPQEFADAWFEIIQSFRVIASADDFVGSVFYTELPDEIEVAHVNSFLDGLDSLVPSCLYDSITDHGFVPVLEIPDVERCGREAFGSYWDEVRDLVIISDGSQQGHPFLFRTDVVEVTEVPGFQNPVTAEREAILYPRMLSRFLKYQIFPLLKNGSRTSGHNLLAAANAERGTQYEKNIHEFLISKGYEAYRGAEITRRNQNEVDLICIRNDEALIIELKFLLPPIGINSQSGVDELDEEFDRKIFNEVNRDSSRSPSGPTFNEKIAAWSEMDSGSRFYSEAANGDDGRVEQSLPSNWDSLTKRPLVVSNVVPTYVEKRGVRFLTGLEFYDLIENGNLDVLRPVEPCLPPTWL